MKYKVDQFTFFKMSEKEYVLQNSSGISIINNSKLIKFFLELDYTNRLEISDEDIQGSFGSEKDNAKNFLLSNNMIREIVKKTTYDKVIYIANNCRMIHLFYLFFSFLCKIRVPAKSVNDHNLTQALWLWLYFNVYKDEKNNIRLIYIDYIYDVLYCDNILSLKGEIK